MKFSIIVPVYNDPHFKTCLDSLLRLDYPRDQYEIIVVDNNSQPTLQSLINVRYVHEPIPGSYQARNQGLKLAQGDIIAFTDSDCVVDAQWLRQIETILVDDVDAVMGYAAGANDNAVARYEQRMYDDNIGKFVNRQTLRRIDTRNFAMKRMVYEKIGNFNPRLAYGGDMEYGARAHQAGFTMVFSKSVQVAHHNETNLPKLLQKRIRQNAGNMIITQIHDQKFVEEYFPHLFKFYLYRNALIRHLYVIMLSIWSKLTFWIPGSPFGYQWFKLQNVLAMRLGQITAQPLSLTPLPKIQKTKELKDPEVSIIILSWNSKTITQACVDSIITNIKNTTYELILIDNHSHDGSVDMIQRQYSDHPNIRCVLNDRNLGYAGGNNQGYSLAKGKYILLLNSDTLVPEKTVETLTQFLDTYPQYGGATTKLLNPDGTTQYFMHRRFPTMVSLIEGLIYKRWQWFCSKRVRKYLYLDKDFTTDFDIEQAAGTCILLRREALAMKTHRSVSLQNKIFDDNHFPLYYNDVDLCYRIHQIGWKIRCLTSVSITHHKGVSVRKLSLSTNLKRYIPAVYWYWRLHLLP